MSKTFKLEIQLGNDAMYNSKHVGIALMEIGRSLTRPDKEDQFFNGYIYDSNGNLVGDWQVENHG